ncbi:MAG: HVO_2922 family protein [Halobacteriaceae archaeon]
MANATFELYEDRSGEWRWRLVHDNGNIIADSGEGYASRQKCRQGLESVRRNASTAPVVDLADPPPQGVSGRSG